MTLTRLYFKPACEIPRETSRSGALFCYYSYIVAKGRSVVRIKAVLVAIAIAGTSVSLAAQNTSMRPPITGIAKVSVYATDLSKSKQFYGTFLGFPQIASTSASAPMEFRVSSKQSIEVQAAPPGTTDFLAYIAFATTDLDSMQRYLVSQKVPIEGEIQTQPDGTQFLWVKDPEGHRLQFVQRPSHGHLLPVSSSTSKNTPQPISQIILHAGFIVHNRAEEDRFFHDILGFVEGWQGGSGHKLEWVDMRVPDGTNWLEYMLQDPTREERRRQRRPESLRAGGSRYPPGRANAATSPLGLLPAV